MRSEEVAFIYHVCFGIAMAICIQQVEQYCSPRLHVVVVVLWSQLGVDLLLLNSGMPATSVGAWASKFCPSYSSGSYPSAGTWASKYVLDESAKKISKTALTN